MTIKEYAQEHGITTAAIYKRIKGKGVKLTEIKAPTGELTPEGQQILDSIFAVTETTHSTAPDASTELSTEVERLKNQVNQLTTEVEMLRDERDYLRQQLDRAQQIQAMALQKVPALPAPGERKPWYKRLFGK